MAPKEVTGSGIGLAVVKRIVELHGAEFGRSRRAGPQVKRRIYAANRRLMWHPAFCAGYGPNRHTQTVRIGRRRVE